MSGVEYGNAAARKLVGFDLISGRLSRHPDAAAEAAGGLHGCPGGMNIYFLADNGVHAQTAENLKTGNSLTNQPSPIVAAELVCFEHYRTVTGLLSGAGKRQLVNRALWCPVRHGHANH